MSTKKINKIIRNSVEYVIEDADAQTSIDSIVENFNKLEIPDKTSDLENDSGYINQIKTINGQSLVGEGNIEIQGGSGDAYTKQESDELFAFKSDVEELQLYKFPNATIFGTPTIQNGQVSNFSNINYLQFPFIVNFQNRPFEINFSFTTPSDLSGQQNILDSSYGLAFALRVGKVICVASENGNSWTTGELISDETLSPNTTYYFKIYWDNSSFGFVGGLSKDSFTIFKETSMIVTPYPKTILIGRSFVDGGNYFKGSVNLNNASLTISDKVVWQGMDDVGLATRAAVDLSNIDAKGVEVIENIVENKITTKQDTLVSGTNIKTINGNSILGSGDLHIEGGEGGSGSQIIEISSSDYNELTDEQKNDPTILYVISDGQSEYYKKNEVYNKEESDSKYSLKGEGKVYTGASGVTVNNDNNTIGVNALYGINYANYTNYFSLTTSKTTNSGVYTPTVNFRKLKVNNTNETLNGTTLLDLDSVYATKSEIETTIGNINNILNTI